MRIDKVDRAIPSPLPGSHHGQVDVRFSGAKSRTIFRRVDSNKSGTISRKEWRRAFRQIDQNGDKQLSRREMRRFFRRR